MASQTERMTQSGNQRASSSHACRVTPSEEPYLLPLGVLVRPYRDCE